MMPVRWAKDKVLQRSEEAFNPKRGGILKRMPPRFFDNLEKK